MRRSLNLLAVTSMFLMTGCDEPDAEEVVEEKSTIAQEEDGATVYLNVNDDGEALVVVKNAEGKILTEGVEGQLVVSQGEGKEPLELELKATGEAGVYAAQLPELEAPATTVTYAVQVEKKELQGTLVLPPGGTEELAQVSTIEAEVKASHGGVVQVVGGAQLEVVADAKSGELRVYPSEAETRPKKVEVSVDVHGEPERVELDWHSEGYFVADLRPGWVPRHTTLIVTEPDAHVHVALVGFHPGVVFHLGAPPLYFGHHHHWHHHGHARGHFKGTPWGPPGHQYKFKFGKHHHFHHHGHVDGQVDVQVKGHLPGPDIHLHHEPHLPGGVHVKGHLPGPDIHLHHDLHHDVHVKGHVGGRGPHKGHIGGGARGGGKMHFKAK